MNYFSIWKILNNIFCWHGSVTWRLQLVPVFGAVCVLLSGCSSLCSLTIETQLVYVHHYQWKGISKLVIAERIRCWWFVELPIWGAAFGSCCIQYICSLTVYLTWHTWTERNVCASTCCSYHGMSFSPSSPPSCSCVLSAIATAPNCVK